MALLIRVFFCIFIFGFFLYRYIDHQNAHTLLSIEVPLIEKQLERLEEDNMALFYQIEQFESPQHLLEMARRPEYKHLRYPYNEEVFHLKKEGKR